eukprot:symbB.v1.2.041501.t1/scaffold8291.1/size6948/1
MGQLCGPGVLCDLDKVSGDRRLQDEGTRKVDQLTLELRMLKDENYRIREEQLRLEKELKVRAPPWQPGHAGHGPCVPSGRSEGHGAGPVSNGRARSRPERDQADQTRFRRAEDFGAPGGRAGPPGRGQEDRQLAYMKEVIRSLQAENTRLRKGDKTVNASSGVSEEEYRRLEGQLRMLQRQHGRVQAAGSAGVSTAVSGVSTPLSSFNEDQRAMRALAGHYEALQREQEELRNKACGKIHF